MQFHPTLFADVAGWGSTVKAGPKPYRHVPVQIILTGHVTSVSGYIYMCLSKLMQINVVEDWREYQDSEDVGGSYPG